MKCEQCGLKVGGAFGCFGHRRDFYLGPDSTVGVKWKFLKTRDYLQALYDDWPRGWMFTEDEMCEFLISRNPTVIKPLAVERQIAFVNKGYTEPGYHAAYGVIIQDLQGNFWEYHHFEDKTWRLMHEKSMCVFPYPVFGTIGRGYYRANAV